MSWKRMYANVIKSLPLPLSIRLGLDYFLRFKKWPNISNPKTFTEKLLWRAVYDRRDILSFTCDKNKMKEFAVRECPGINVPKNIWMGKDLNEINADIFKGRSWVMKPNHSSGHYVIGADVPTLKNEDISEWWKDYGSVGTSGWGGWAYSKAEKAIIIEELIGDGKEDLIDYKFYVFEGKVVLLQVISGRRGVKRRYILDDEWRLLYSHEDAMGNFLPSEPTGFKEMLRCASLLGMKFDFMRVDLYWVNSQIWFSELTPYPSTSKSSRPDFIEKILGNAWSIPSLDSGEVR